jgi:outer membrane receptor protein involved in Fe transport
MVGDPFTLTAAQIEANKSLPFADQYHYNVDAFAMAQPLSSTVGNFGNTPVRILRNPTWHQWDLTLSRRFPVNAMGRKNAGLKLQVQAYNVFNEVQFTNLNATYTFTGTGNVQNTNTTPVAQWTGTGCRPAPSSLV